MRPGKDEKADELAVPEPERHRKGDPDPGKVGTRADDDPGAGLGLAKEPADQRRLGGALGASLQLD